MEDIKKIILSGGIVKFPYKEEKKEWVGEAYIFIYIHYKIKIVVNIPTIKLCPGGYKDYAFSEIDEAVKNFANIVYHKDNLMYKLQEAEIALGLDGKFGDLDDEKFCDLVFKKREELLKGSVV